MVSTMMQSSGAKCPETARQSQNTNPKNSHETGVCNQDQIGRAAKSKLSSVLPLGSGLRRDGVRAFGDFDFGESRQQARGGPLYEAGARARTGSQQAALPFCRTSSFYFCKP